MYFPISWYFTEEEEEKEKKEKKQKEEREKGDNKKENGTEMWDKEIKQ